MKRNRKIKILATLGPASAEESMIEKLHQAGQKRVQVEGAGGSDWVLIDAGDIVVHLFKPEARAMYALEKMWGEDLDEAI